MWLLALVLSFINAGPMIDWDVKADGRSALGYEEHMP